MKGTSVITEILRPSTDVSLCPPNYLALSTLLVEKDKMVTEGNCRHPFHLHPQLRTILYVLVFTAFCLTAL